MIDTMDPIGGNVSGVRYQVSGGLSSFAHGFGGLGFAPVKGDDGNDRSFITRDFNGVRGKENGTIPFYRRFSDWRCQLDFMIGAGRNQWRGCVFR
jgi:hypothetical protein